MSESENDTKSLRFLGVFVGFGKKGGWGGGGRTHLGHEEEPPQDARETEIDLENGCNYRKENEFVNE